MKKSITTLALFSLFAFAGILPGAIRPAFVPVITEDDPVSVTMDEDASPIAFTLTLNATDGDAGDTLTWSISSAASHGTATASGTGTSKAIGYVPNADWNGTDSFVVMVSDGADGSDTITVNVTVNARNDGPINTVPGAQTVDEDTNLVFSTGTGNPISMADADVAETVNGKLQVTLTVNHGSLTLHAVTNLTFTSGDGTSDATMTFTALPAALNSAMDGARYTPAADYSGADSLSVNTSDQGNTGAGGVLTDTDAVAITVLDTTAPTAPNMPDLQAASDTGAYSDDNITDVTTPAFDIAGLESGSSVTLTLVPVGGGEAIVVPAVSSGSSCTITVASPLSPGVYTVTARQTDLAGNVSVASAAMSPSLYIAVASSVTTQSVTEIASSHATGNGTIVALGSPSPTAHGLVWNTTGSPTLADSVADNGAATSAGAYVSALTGLSPNTPYYVRAYATSDLTTVYGDQVTFTALQTFTLTYAADAGGAISGVSPQTVDYDGTGTPVTAVPDANYHFVSWSDGITTATRTDSNVTADISVTATFVSEAAAQRQALIDLYVATNGDNWTNNTGWKAGLLHTDGFAMPGTEGTWFGITASVGNITAINLGTNNLVGSIPSAIGDLSNLSILILGANYLSGHLPTSVGSLTNLTLLRLSGNQLSGSLPLELGNLTRLTTLDINTNQFSGTLPASLGNLTSLQYLALYSNQFVGTLPSEFGNLVNLRTLDLHGNQLNGSLPASMSGLTALETLIMHSNQFTGSLPEEWGGLASLRFFRIASNPLSGPIPASFGNLTNLTDFIAGNNFLSGTIPPELGNLSNLINLDLRFNALTGSIPISFAGLSSLKTLLLEFNDLSGSLPPELGSLTELTIMLLQSNEFTGSIPSELGNLTNLQTLWLQLNQLSGPIPTALGNLHDLRSLRLYSNDLNGPIPPEIGALTQLTELSLYDNSLEGTLPSELGNLILLQILSLRGNMLSGPIPSSLTNLGLLVPASTDFGYNAFFTLDEALITFLATKDPDWESTQTVAPAEVTATSLDNAAILVSWLPIAYTGGSGYYTVFISENAGGPYTVAGQTADKTTSSVQVTGLTPGTRYYFVVQTHTDTHSSNQNIVESEYSAEVSAFAWTQINVQISGTVTEGGYPLAGVVMNGLTGSPVTDASGIYAGTEAAGWSGTVTPSLAGYTFVPVSRTYPPITVDQTAQDYTATTLSLYTISGTVTVGGSPLSGVVMNGLTGSPATNALGIYTGTEAAGWSGTVTPTLEGYAFVPDSRTYTTITADQTAQDYVTTTVIPTITVTSPNGGETWAVGSTHAVTWTQTDLTGSVTVDLYKGGVYLKTLGTAEGTAGTFSWLVSLTETAAADYTILVWQDAVTDESNADFSITPVLKIDFDQDGQEDLLWRYQATGAYQGINCVWLMNQSGELLFIPLGADQVETWTADLTKASDPALSHVTPMKAGTPEVPASVESTSSPLRIEDLPILTKRIAKTTPMASDREWAATAEATTLLGMPKLSAAGDGSLGITSLTEVDYLYPQSVWDLDWEIGGAGDFDGDGDADILWRNYGTGPYSGFNCIWYMEGADVTGYAYPDRVTDLNWMIVATGDFDGNGEADILWRYMGTEVYVGFNCIWYMDGGRVVDYGYPDRVTDLDWEIVGAGDFDRNGELDILWRNTGTGPFSGYNCIWYMDGGRVVDYGYPDRVTDLSWEIAGTGDFNRDGYADIVWRYYGGGAIQGYNCVWYMENARMVGVDYPTCVSDLNWKIVNR